MKQIHYILSMHPKHEFKIFNSRRTPEELNLKLTDNLGNYQNAKLVHFNSSAPDLFEDCLKESALKFVTPDSANLVFESLSTQGQTYLVQIEDPSYRRIFGAKKIRDSMNELVLSKRVGVVSILNKKGGVCISKLERPSLHFEPLAEVEKVAFSIMKFMNQQK
jgi:mitochondrial fission protein ELM1